MNQPRIHADERGSEQQITNYSGSTMSTAFEWLTAIGFILGLSLVIGFPFWLYETRDKRKRYQSAFGGREPLDEQTFYERYFQSRGVPIDVVVKVKRVLEDVLDDDLSRLQAEDDFSQNLSFFFQYDSMASLEIVQRLEEEFGITISDEEAAKTFTVAQIVDLVWLKLRQRAA